MPTAMADPCSCGMGDAGFCQHCDRGCAFCDTFQYEKCERNQQYNQRKTTQLRYEFMPLVHGITILA